MPNISISELDDLLSKLFNEHVRLHAYFQSSSGAITRITGYVDSKTKQNGLIISTSGPPLDAERGYFQVRPFDHAAVVWYGERREMPADKQHLADVYGDSVLIVSLPQFKEWFALYFTI